MFKLRNANILVLVLISVFLFGINHYVMARAGGGESGGSGWILKFILFPIVLVYILLLNSKLKKKSQEVKTLTDKISKGDELWNHRHLLSTSRLVFMRVQKAWMERNQDLVKDVITNKIYEKHKAKTDEMIAKGTQNILKDIKISEIVIISVSDYKDNSKDSFSAYINASMIDYTIDEKTSKVISGDDSESNSFSEIWTFLRENDQWKLDEISQNTSFDVIDNSKVFSE
jgi:hypothetical protein